MSLNPEHNNFGGDWTENKIEILVEYAKAYLRIMEYNAAKYNWQLLYFDGFAGSGEITKGKDENKKIIIGAARRILEINEPRSFDLYYFVEKQEKNYKLLKEYVEKTFPEKDPKVVNDDCNNRIKRMSKFLTTDGKKFRTLAYIDPCGMQLNWSSLQALEKLSVDVWILIPSGMGVNRMLTLTGDISDEWLDKLEVFLGMNRSDIVKYFYKEKRENTLFGEHTSMTKNDRAIEKSAELYQERLGELFKYVSNTYVLKNSTNAIMYHLLLASNNKNAVKIADDIIAKYNKLN